MNPYLSKNYLQNGGGNNPNFTDEENKAQRICTTLKDCIGDKW